MKNYIQTTVIELAVQELIREGRVEATMADVFDRAERILRFAENSKKKSGIRFRKGILEVEEKLLVGATAAWVV